MNLKEELKHSIVFQNLTDGEIELIRPLCTEEEHPAGTELYKEGDFAEKLYIITKGRTDLDLMNKMTPFGSPRRITVDTIGPGEAMGWSALVQPHVYTLSCECVEDCRIIAVNGPGLKALMNRECQIGLKVMMSMSKIIANRLTHTRELMIGERGLHLVANY